MNLYKISQDINNGYDTFDSAVVVAESALSASRIHPQYYGSWQKNKTLEEFWADESGCNWTSWVKSPADVKVDYLGIAEDSLEAGTIIVSSFNAG